MEEGTVGSSFFLKSNELKFDIFKEVNVIDIVRPKEISNKIKKKTNKYWLVKEYGNKKINRKKINAINKIFANNMFS